MSTPCSRFRWRGDCSFANREVDHERSEAGAPDVQLRDAAHWASATAGPSDARRVAVARARSMLDRLFALLASLRRSGDASIAAASVRARSAVRHAGLSGSVVRPGAHALP